MNDSYPYKEAAKIAIATVQETSAGLLEASLLVPFCSQSDVVQAFSLALS